MPVTPTYPGVYIEEIPSGVRTLTGVATSITAFVGRALRGPVNEPITINSFGDYERIFGGLWVLSSMSFAVRDFFLNGGGQAIIVRLFAPSQAAAKAANDVATAAKAAADLVTSTADTVASAAREEADKTTGDASTKSAAEAVAVAAELAARGSIKAVVDAARSVADAQVDVDAKAAAKKVSDAAALEATSGVSPTATSVYDEADAMAATITGTLAEKNAAKAVVDAAKFANHSAANDVASAAEAAVPYSKARIEVGGLTLEASSEGAWGSKLGATVALLGGPGGDVFNLTVTVDGAPLETFRNVTVKDGSRRVDKVLLSQSSLVRWSSPFPSAPPAVSNGTAKASAASDGTSLSSTDLIASESAKTGLFALEKADLFNLLCIPPFQGDTDMSPVIPQATAYCEKRRAFYVIDAPATWNNKDAAKSGVSNLGSSKNTAVFFPQLVEANPLRENQLENFPPCGAVAGIFARTDATRGVWKAPAGLDATLVGVPKLSVSLTDAENGELNPLGINCLRSMPAVGRVVWGARTLQGNDQLASEWKYIPVRRTALFLEESLYRGTQWVVFEPNDEPLWAQIRLNIGAFLHNLFRQGAFQGKTPREAYFVKCDKETTTQNDINLGIVNIVVGFAPLKPAEFVIIKFQQMAGQIEG